MKWGVLQMIGVVGSGLVGIKSLDLSGAQIHKLLLVCY